MEAAIPLWLQWLVAAGGALITFLLFVIAWFLREIHADFKEMRQNIEAINIWVAGKTTLLEGFETRLKKLEHKIFGE